MPIPAAGPVVDEWRARLDPTAAWGIPAHVTVLFPFLPPDELGTQVESELETIFSAVDAFDASFRRVKWFAEQVLWLAPEPDQPVRELTKRVTSRWDHLVPYEGNFPYDDPHLTVGQRSPVDLLREAAHALESDLPIDTVVDEVWLMTGERAEATWRREAAFRLGGSRL